MMGRPVKWRRIKQMPSVLQFSPDGAGQLPSDNILLIEEYEAIRLKDLEGLEQEECAERMQVSRPTFQRILLQARTKVADSLINGKGIRIAGGNFAPAVCPVRCLDCGLEWQETAEILAQHPEDYTCPRCSSTRIRCGPGDAGAPGAPDIARPGRNRYCQRGCRRRGRYGQPGQE